jgi:hypothetical protein
MRQPPSSEQGSLQQGNSSAPNKLGFNNTIGSLKNTMSNYDIPNANLMMPTKQWYNSMDPSVKAGVMAPWQDAAGALKEQMASMGQLGNPSAGISGQGATGLGELWSRAGKDMGLQMWNMSQPAMQANWQAKLDQGKLSGMEGYMDATAANQAVQQNYQNAMQRRGEVLQGRQAPFTMAPGFLGSIAQMPAAFTPGTPSTGSQFMNMLPMLATAGLGSAGI